MKTLLFDGEKYQKHRPQAENPDTGKLAPDLYLHGPTYPVVFRVRDYPLLFGHGFVVCQDEFVDPSGGFQLDYASAGLKRTGTILLDNSRQVILRTAPRKIPGSYYEIWVDRAMADQVRRWRYFHWVSDKAQLLYDIQINYAKRDGIWLPSGWTFLTFDERQTPSRTLEMSVNHVDIEPDMQVNDFRIAPSEGMVVFDVPAGREYVVGNESADIEQLRSATGSWWPVALRVISLLAVAGLVSLFFWHRRRSDS